MTIFFGLKKKWGFWGSSRRFRFRNVYQKNCIKIKRAKKSEKNYKTGFLANLKKLYKKKKINFLSIRKRMYKKIINGHIAYKLYKKIPKIKRRYAYYYKYRGANRRSLTKRAWISKLSRRYRGMAWLKVGFKRKAHKNWWLMRELKRKVAFYYGFIHMRKFRYINNFNKNMAVNSNYGLKLECMLNIFILRLNFFDNIFQANNLIRKTRFINIDNKLCTYPYRIVNVFQTVSINKFYFKKMLNIFIKRCKFNKSYVLKNFVKKGYRRKRVIRNVVNIPSFIEYNYKIMHFTVIDRPKLSQLKGYGYGLDNSSLFTWSVNTKIRYDYK